MFQSTTQATQSPTVVPSITKKPRNHHDWVEKTNYIQLTQQLVDLDRNGSKVCFWVNDFEEGQAMAQAIRSNLRYNPEFKYIKVSYNSRTDPNYVNVELDY